MSWTIETEDLGKRYRDVTAVDGLSLRVAEGEIYAFLGLNGAGKTTTIRMLLGMIKPTRGSATVLGKRVRPSSPLSDRLRALALGCGFCFWESETSGGNRG
jgi:ABC-type multidrug transport system ATPase subunit